MKGVIVVGILAVLLVSGCGREEINSVDGVVVLKNQGPSMEGHTTRGFRGMGSGLFVGDNLNPGFPNGDGVQTFLSFDLSGIKGNVESAILRSNNFKGNGDPFRDLGNLNAEEIRYSSFSADLWDLEPLANGDSCVFSANGEVFECDLGEAVQNSLDDNYDFAQFRLRFDKASDSDGQQDLAMFFISNSNTNEPGIFELEVKMI